MRLIRLVVILAALGASCRSQISSGYPLCFAFNDNGSTPATFGAVPLNNFVFVYFVAPTTSIVDHIDLWGPGTVPQNHSLLFYLFDTPSLAGPLTLPALGDFAGSFQAGVNWTPTVASSPVALTAGNTYALAIGNSGIGGVSCQTIHYDPAGPVQLPYLSPNVCLFPPVPFPPGQIGVKLRFRGVACSPVPLATVSWLGFPCPRGLAAAGLSSFTPPVLGAPWPVVVHGPLGAVAHLFWSAGTDPVGTAILGTSCLLHLDLNSFWILASLGAEPLLTGTLPTFPTNFLTWTLWVPPDPALAGTVFGCQALIVSGSGPINLGGGLFGQTTNALQLTLGF
jgi:hypothetical protein